MKKLIEDNYSSIVKRGLITPNTTKDQFVDKLFEEVAEFEEVANEIHFTEYPQHDNFNEELADVILVCFNIAKHYNIDIEEELKKKIAKNHQRADV